MSPGHECGLHLLNQLAASPEFQSRAIVHNLATHVALTNAIISCSLPILSCDHLAWDESRIRHRPHHPALGAAFTGVHADFENSGELGETLAQRFPYVVDGAVHLNAAAKIIFWSHGIAYVPQGVAHRITSREKKHEPLSLRRPIYQALQRIHPV